MPLLLKGLEIILQIYYHFFFLLDEGLGKGTIGKDNVVHFNRLERWMYNYKCVLINKYIYLVLNLNIQWGILSAFLIPC